MPGVRVAPGHHEHLLALADQVLDHAPAGGQVDDVVLVDHRRDDQQRELADALRDRAVLDQLEPACAAPPRPGVTARSVPTSNASGSTIAGTRGGAARSAARCRRPGQRAAAAGVDGRLQRRRVEQRVVARRERVDQVGQHEPTRVSSRQSRSASGQQRLGRLAGRQVGLHAAAQQRVAGPGRVGEPAVPRAGCDLRSCRPRSGRARRRAAPPRRPTSRRAAGQRGGQPQRGAVRAGAGAARRAPRRSAAGPARRRRRPRRLAPRTSPAACAVTQRPAGAAPRGAGSCRSGPWAARPPARCAAGTCTPPPAPWRTRAARPAWRVAPGLERHGGADLLAEVGVRDADHRRLGDGRVLVEHLLDLPRVDVVAAPDDQVLLPVDDVVVAVVVHPGQVAGAEPAAP